MESDSTLAAIALGLSLVCFGAVALSEASLVSIRRGRLQDLLARRTPGATVLHRLHSLPMGPTGSLTLAKVFFFSAGLVSAIAVVIASSGVQWVTIALVSAAAVVFLSFISIAGKALASGYREPIALRVAALVRALAWLLNPLLAFEDALARKALRLRAIGANGAKEAVPSEVSLPLDPGGEALDEHEVRMIQGVVRLDITVAREIMVPRVDMVACEVEAPIAELAEHMVKGGHSRVPVYRDDLDHIEGIAYARDVLDYQVQGEDISKIPVRNVIRPPLFIPESKTLQELLSEFQQRRMHMAIVVDEYGGVSGLVTIEDLLEEIVGEIQDEFDVGEPEVEAVSDNEFFIDARVSIDQLNELLSVAVEGDGFDTLGGFVYHRLGKIPSPGDTIEYDGINIEVISALGRRLKKLRVTRTEGREPAAQ